MAILPDNRLRLPAPEIDFVNDVGITGQEHDTYPTADTQARYDWMRMYLQALLAHQSSHLQPINFRTGTTWFDLVIEAYRYWNGTDFAPLAKGIKVPGEAGSEQEDRKSVV